MSDAKTLSGLPKLMAWTIAAIALALTGAMVAGFAADLWWVLELVASWRGSMAVWLLTLLLVELAWRRRGRVLVVLLAGSGLGLGSCLPWYFDRSLDESGTTEALVGTPMTIAWGNAPGGIGNTGVDALLATEADIVMVAEVGGDWRLAESGSGGYRVVYRDSKRADKAVMVLAKVPGVLVERLDMAGGASGLEVTVSRGGTTWRILAMHLQSPRSSELVENRNKNLVFAGSWASEKSRIGPCLVLGDLNTTPHSPAFARMMEVGGLEHSMQGRGVMTTWPSTVGGVPLGLTIWGRTVPVFGIPIDHVLHSRDVVVRELDTLSLPGSDHAGLVATLGVRRER